MSVRARILIPMIITAVVVAAAILASDIIQFSNYVNSSIEDKLDEAVQEMMNEIKTLEDESYITALYFAHDAKLISSIENDGPDVLMNRAMRLYSETGADLCIVTDINGITLVRTDSRKINGEDLSEMLSVKTALSGTICTAVERGEGDTVRISANTGTPIFNEDDKMLGVVVVGFRLDTEVFVDKLKDISGCEHTVYIDNVRVATTLLNSDGTRAVGMTAPESVGRSVMAGGDVTGQFSLLNRNMLTKYIPLRDGIGEIRGMLFAGQFLTEKTNTVWAFIMTGGLITAGILLLGTLIISFAARRISSPIVKMIDKAYYDALTGIYNRRFFDESTKRLIASLSRMGGTLSLLMIDIDFFKQYNDTYGHSAGDNCLRKIAEALSKSITRADDFIARYGGEEFVVVLPNTDENGTRMIANKLLENVMELNLPHKKSTAASCVTVSVGATLGTVNHMQSSDDYVKKADDMLYKSKQTGRNRYNFESL
ncbi:MAG: diguanylate cyclase [Oscillospiraceae bacterium]|nr:diguanylate cyclase [Oscillospiraceae bacterium]